MSMKRLAVLSAVHTSQLLSSNGTAKEPSQGYDMSATAGGGGGGGGGVSGRAGRFESDLHGNVNILLGGAMLGGVIVVVILVCYCCHRGMWKRRPQEYTQYWRTEPDVHSLEVFTMDSHAMCYDRAGSRGLPARPDEATTLPGGPVGLTVALTPVPARLPAPGPPPAYESLIFRAGPLQTPADEKPAGLEYGLGGPCPGRVLPAPVEAATTTTTTTATTRRTRPPAGAGSLKERESRRDDEGLPSYEAALRLEAQGYV